MMDSDELADHKYPEDDTRHTSKKELAGWYCYGWAAEVFTVCAMGELLQSVFLFSISYEQGNTAAIYN